MPHVQVRPTTLPHVQVPPSTNNPAPRAGPAVDQQPCLMCSSRPRPTVMPHVQVRPTTLPHMQVRPRPTTLPHVQVGAAVVRGPPITR
eukprot:358538-Chlamydomonas_euryale.AAC.1